MVLVWDECFWGTVSTRYLLSSVFCGGDGCARIRWVYTRANDFNLLLKFLHVRYIQSGPIFETIRLRSITWRCDERAGVWWVKSVSSRFMLPHERVVDVQLVHIWPRKELIPGAHMMNHSKKVFVFMEILHRSRTNYNCLTHRMQAT